MDISKQNVFLVAGRKSVEGESRGEVTNSVVCSVDENAVRSLMAQIDPASNVISVTSLVSLEDTAKKMKAVLAGTDKSWTVHIDPALQALVDA